MIMDKYALKPEYSASLEIIANRMADKLKTAVAGATGYSGLELARLLRRHPPVDAPLLLRRSAETEESAAGLTPVSSNGNGHSKLVPFSWSALEQHGVELLFL